MFQSLQITCQQSTFLIGLSSNHIGSTLSALCVSQGRVIYIHPSQDSFASTFIIFRCLTSEHNSRYNDGKGRNLQAFLCTVLMSTNTSCHDLVNNTSLPTTLQISMITVLAVSNCIRYKLGG